VARSERLLEIGCGQGLAVSLLCESASIGSITAIDRSKPMIDQAVRRTGSTSTAAEQPSTR
jgi:ubiquinone/menaquinone biosynthesis C-methylase UbiE